MLKAHNKVMNLQLVLIFILLAREDLQKHKPVNSELSLLFATPARMERTLKNYNLKPLPWKMAEKRQNEYAEPFGKFKVLQSHLHIVFGIT